MVGGGKKGGGGGGGAKRPLSYLKKRTRAEGLAHAHATAYGNKKIGLLGCAVLRCRGRARGQCAAELGLVERPRGLRLARVSSGVSPRPRARDLALTAGQHGAPAPVRRSRTLGY